MQRLRLKSDKPSRIVEDDVVPCALYLTPFFTEKRMLMVGQSKLMPGQLPDMPRSGYAYGGGHTDTHTDVRIKVISRNQARLV